MYIWSNMKTKTKVITSLIVIITIIIIGIYLKWKVGKSIHFNIQYKSQVEKVIKQTVKEECLR